MGSADAKRHSHTTVALAREQLVTRWIDPDLTESLGALLPDNADPWLLLHRGHVLCRLRSEFEPAQQLVIVALARFHQRGDMEGVLWATVEQLVLSYHSRAFADGMALFDAAMDDQLPPYLRGELLFGRFLCQIGLDLLREAEASGHAALQALDQEPDERLRTLGRIQMLRNLAAAYHYLGKSRLAVQATEEARRLSANNPNAAHTEPWCCYELGLAYWRKGELGKAAATLDEARRLAESWRHHELWRWAVAAQGHLLRDQDYIPEARAAYMLADGWGEDIHGPIMLQLREGRLSEARWGCEAMLTLANEINSPVYQADARALLGIACLQQGRPVEAMHLFDQASASYAELGYRYNGTTVEYYTAAALLMLGRGEEANRSLARALAFSAAEDVYTCDWWMPQILEPLLTRAVQQRIEPHHAERMLHRRFFDTHSGADIAPNRPRPSQTELDIARQTQLNLLPPAPPFVPDLDIAALSLPAAEVGGDFYGFYPSGADPKSGATRELGLALSDISGKGLQSALLTSGAAVAISTAVADRPRPGDLLMQVHRALAPYTRRSNLYVALCYAVLEQHEAGWQLIAANAGAISPLIRRRDGRVEWMDVAGLPLGSGHAGRYTDASTTLAPGDVVVLISDGVIEAMNQERDLFGFERFEEAVAAAPANGNARDMLHHILDTVQAYVADAPQHDDMTIVVVQVKAAAPDARG